MRVGRSNLNVHRFALGLNDTEKCLCDRPETVSHYLTTCFLYNEERHALYTKVCQILPNFISLPDKLKVKVLLEGVNLHSEEPDSRNIPLALSVQNFIFQTKRFHWISPFTFLDCCLLKFRFSLSIWIKILYFVYYYFEFFVFVYS